MKNHLIDFVASDNHCDKKRNYYIFKKAYKKIKRRYNKEYVNKEKFPKMIGRKISQAQRIREDSDYDDYEPSFEKTEQQINTAQELIGVVEEYINNYYKNN